MTAPLLLGIHHHQPDGNFGHVFEQCYEACYGPFLKLVDAFPRVKLSLHHTGPLLEWIEKNRPDYFALLRKVVERGQVELLGGGFYEPILSVLPERDAVGQIEMMNAYLSRHFGVMPRGMWLAERVWEPQLPAVLTRANMRFTLVDDHHFRASGMTGPLSGYYATEKAGRALGVFPIDMTLRQTIPFAEVDETIRAIERAGKHGAVTYGDDGEKFGVWPGTSEWVWTKGWLRTFFERLSSSTTIETLRFSDWFDTKPPSGRVYLPTASYEEMGEWALPTTAQPAYHQVRKMLDERPDIIEGRAFVRGGTWPSFMSKYPEANYMHKKMLLVSDAIERARGRVTAADAEELTRAERELYRAQCNCSYWHGLFGGLYLNYLRDAVYHHLIDAENVALKILRPEGGARAETRDYDADLEDEVLLSNAKLSAYIKPSAGGGVFELDFRPRCFNVGNVLGRRAEGYHDKLRAALKDQAQAGDAPKSIHDLVAVKSEGLADLLAFDRHLRSSFVEHLVAADTRLEDFESAREQQLAPLASATYRVVSTGTERDRAEAQLRIDAGDEGKRFTIDKTIILDGASIEGRYRVESHSDAGDARFAIELNLTLLAGDAQDRYFHVPGQTLEGDDSKLRSRGVVRAESLEMVNEWDRFAMRIVPSAGAEIWRYPLETASQSEGGFERTYQGSVLLITWPIRLAAQQSQQHHVRIEFEER